VACGVLSSNITSWGALQHHDEYFKVIEVKHKRKLKFWSEYNSALQKHAAKAAKIAKSSKA
jgi:hypothetical protein